MTKSGSCGSQQCLDFVSLEGEETGEIPRGEIRSAKEGGER
jgi:hypothetical protein